MTNQEAQAKLTEVMEKFLDLACKKLPDDVYEKLKECRDSETSEMQKVIYGSPLLSGHGTAAFLYQLRRELPLYGHCGKSAS